MTAATEVYRTFVLVAQWIERLPPKEKVSSSSLDVDTEGAEKKRSVPLRFPSSSHSVIMLSSVNWKDHLATNEEK